LKAGYVVIGKKGIFHGEHASYDGLLKEIVRFFKTGKVPIDPDETIELFAFMSAADISKAKGGVPIELKGVIEQAEAERKK
jgi:hypothetical protein